MLAVSYAFVLAAETLGRLRAVLRPDARRSMLPDHAGTFVQFSFAARVRGRNELGTNL